MKKILKVFALCFLTFVGTNIAQAKISIPEQLPQELVSDYAGMLTAGQKAELNAKLRAYYDKTTNVFVVVTIPSIEETGEATLQDWNMKLADTWKPGDSEKSNGLIMTISGKASPFKVRINPGRGLTGALTDAYLKRMVEDTMKPVLNAPTNYYNGINVAVDAMATKVGDEFSGKGKATDTASENVDGIGVGFFFVAGAILVIAGIISIIASMSIGALVGWLVGASVSVGALWGIGIGVVAGLILGFIGKALTSGGGYGGSSGGGGWGGGSSSYDFGSSSSVSSSDFSSGGGFDGGGAGD